MQVPEILLVAPIWDVSGIAEAARNLYLSLFDMGIRVKLAEIPYWSHLKADLHPEVRDKIQFGLDRDDVRQPVAIHFYPPDPFRGTINVPALFHVNWSLFETDKCPILWRDMLNDKKFLECWVAGDFNVDAYSSVGVDKKKLRFMPLGVDVTRYNPNVEPLKINGVDDDDFVIMTSMDWSIRKNPEAMVMTYLQEFKKNTDTTFVIKAYTGYGDENSKEGIRQSIKKIKMMTRSKAKVVLITDFMHSDIMANFHKRADVWFNMSKGEGWDMGALQSMACGVPVIGADNTAHKMYLDNDNGYPISCEKKEITDPKFLAKSPQFIEHNWFEPNVKETRRLLRQAYDDHKEGKLKDKGKLARETALDFKWKKCAVNTIFELGKYLK